MVDLFCKASPLIGGPELSLTREWRFGYWQRNETRVCHALRFRVRLPLGRGLQLDGRLSGICESNAKRPASNVVVSDDETEIRRQELLESYFLERSEAKASEYNGGPDEKYCRQASRENSQFMGRWKEQLDNVQAEAKSWWMKLHLETILTPRVRGIILLNVLTFLYGSNISIIKTAGTTMDPTLFSVGRFAIASLAFAPFLNRAIKDDNLRSASVELGLLASAGYLTQCVGVLTSGAARVSFISTFTVIVVPLLAGLSGAKISKITWFSAAAALFGVGLLECNGTPFAIGDVWSFASAVMFGVHMLRTEHHSGTLSPEDSLPVMALQLVVITTCSVLWFFSSHLSSGDPMINVHATNLQSALQEVVVLPWLPMLYTGLLSTAFCLWSELVSMRVVKATEAAVIYTTEPLWGAAFAWITLGERWGPNGWLGALFILGGSMTIQLCGRPETPTNKVAFSPLVDKSLDS